jgi:3-isopropylmalate dehydratase small subunit
MAILKKLSLRYISKQYPDNNQGTSCASTDSHGDGPHRYHKEICEEKTGEQKEDQEEVEIDANKKEIQKTKQCDVYITRNVVRLAQQAEETGCDTVMRLRKQKEHLHR